MAAPDQAGISPVLRKARAQGIRVVTWDSDAEPDARDIFVNPAHSGDTGRMLADEAACLMDGQRRMGDPQRRIQLHKPVDGGHSDANRGEVSRAEAGGDTAQRGRSRPGVSGGAGGF